MIRNLKSLGVVVAVVFAMTALGASAASAAEFHTGSASGTVAGDQTTGHVLTTNAGTLTCKTAHFAGTFAASTATQQSLTPKYEGCTAFGFINIPIHVNGCSYLFTNNANVEMHLLCPAGKEIELTAPGCTTKIGPQTLVRSTITNSTNTVTGRMHLSLHTELSGITYNECGTVRTNGTYKGSTTYSAVNGLGNPVDLTYS